MFFFRTNNYSVSELIFEQNINILNLESRKLYSFKFLLIEIRDTVLAH